MNAEQTAILLARIQGYDNRDVTPQNVLAWSEALARVPYDLAVSAVQLHFQNNPDKYLQVGHVIQGARELAMAARRRTVRQQQERSEEIREAALERKAAELGTRVVTEEEAERYGKGLLDAMMTAIMGLSRQHGGPVPKGQGVATAQRVLADYQAKHGRSPIVERRRQPCAIALCVCTHEEPCEAGFVPVDPGDPAAAVTPCPICKPKASAIVENAAKTGDRRAAGQLLREQGKKDDGKGDEW